MLSSEIFESFKNTYFEEHLQTAASILLTLFALAHPQPQLFSRNKNSVAKEPSNFDLLIPWSTKELIFHANTHFSRKIRSFLEPNCYMISKNHAESTLCKQVLHKWQPIDIAWRRKILQLFS